MGEWQPIETAPVDRYVLLYGTMKPHEMVDYKGPIIAAGYFDPIDEAWCCMGSTYAGPWLEPTHWMPWPATPAGEPSQ